MDSSKSIVELLSFKTHYSTLPHSKYPVGWLAPGLWGRSLKSGFTSQGYSLWGKRVVQIIQWFLVSMEQIVLEPEIKYLDEPEILVLAPQPWLVGVSNF